MEELVGMLGYYHHDTGWAGWLVMALSMLAFWGLVVWAVVMLFRSEPPARTSRGGDEPQRILDERFARGEIDEDEYHDRQQVLRAGRTGGEVDAGISRRRV